MAITRRDFLKYTAVTGAALMFGVFDLKPIKAYADANPPVWTSEAISVCGYCSVGCSMIIGSGTIAGYSGNYVTYVQGNPDSPINKGALCSKGHASAQLSTVVVAYSTWKANTAYRVGQCVLPATNYIGWKYECTTAGTSGATEPIWPTTDGTPITDGTVTWTCRVSDAGARIPNPGRLTQPLKRAGGATAWTPITWAQANSEIAALVKATRDATFVTTDGTITVNRCEGIASIGGAAFNNESCYLITKLMRALGVVYLEHQARV
ncbi:MAG: twin-arginine translocation signal domain-containing protein [Nitrospirota bacterium]